MPANLTPQYKEAEDRYRKSTAPEEKMAALKEMLQLIPKHKGTEKLQAEIKRKISEEKESATKKSSAKKGVSYRVDSCGHRQVIVIGPPNTGKSLLISKLTQAELKVAPYPFTTRAPQPAMMKFENIQVQLVDMPPISEEHTEPWIPGIVRTGDAALLVDDLGDDNILENTEAILQLLKKQKVFLLPEGNDPEEMEIGTCVTPTLLVANKKDLEGAEVVFELLQESYGKKFDIATVSALTEEGVEALKRKIFVLLDIMRVYPKPPGKKPDFTNPIILNRGSTVVDFARQIHKELAEKLKSAKIWGAKDYADGQRVPCDYVLQDGIIVEVEAN